MFLTTLIAALAAALGFVAGQWSRRPRGQPAPVLYLVPRSAALRESWAS